jgi:hypothetical protein
MRAKTDKKIGQCGRGQALRPASAVGGQAGQALVELAVFGALFLMVLGAMVSYGLNYSYNLQAQHEAYRRALKIASDPNRGSASYMMMVDKQVPELANPFGIGSTVPFMASSSVARSTTTDAVFDREAPSRGDLPATIMDMQTYDTSSAAPVITRYDYANAGVRRERKASTAQVAALQAEIAAKQYALERASISNQVRIAAEIALIQAQLATFTYGDNELKKYQFIYGDARRSDDKGEMTIVDSCSGEIVDHKSCADQARRLVDVDYCLNLCNHTNSDNSINCPDLCNSKLNPPNQETRTFDPAKGGPWYAANWTVSNGVYTFPVLDKLFEYAGDGTRSMGLQQNQKTDVTREESTRKIETTSRTVTTDDVSWDQTTERTFVWHDNIQPTGYEVPRATLSDYTGDIKQQPIYTIYKGEIRETWETPK